MNKVISIVGFGNIGKLICALLLPYKDHLFTINVMDVDETVCGAILDFKHGNQLYPNHRITFNENELFNQSDFIFHCAGATVPKGKSRLYTCQQSIEITEAIFQNFRPTNTPFIIVVANPVEIISMVTQRITGLPHSNVIGTGTFLDSVRMNHLIQERNEGFTSINAVLIGEHGASAFLSDQFSTLNETKFSAVFNESELDEIVLSVKKAAAQIKETQEVTVYGVSYCAISIFESILFEKAQTIPVSVSIPSTLKKELGDSDLFLSLYSRVDQNGATPILIDHLGEAEIAKLRESYALILACLPVEYR